MTLQRGESHGCLATPMVFYYQPVVAQSWVAAGVLIRQLQETKLASSHLTRITG